MICQVCSEHGRGCSKGRSAPPDRALVPASPVGAESGKVEGEAAAVGPGAVRPASVLS